MGPAPRTEVAEAALAAASAELWRLGILAPWKLDSDQLRVYERIETSAASRFVLEISRRWGKTWLLATKATETCLKKKRARVVYGAPTLKHLQEFIIPTFEALTADAPSDCKPIFNSQSGHWTFPNGSVIHLFGADDKRKADRGRGPAADLAIFDEAGFTPVLRYVIRSIFRPQLLSTGGRMLLGSTPAEEPDHDFTAIAELAERNGTYERRTIYDCPRYTRAQVEKFIADDARDEGLSVEQYVKSDEFRREYLAERVVNKLLIVLPEWAEQRDSLIVDVPRPEFFDGMTMLDFGGSDPHAALLGYWHFTLAKFVIEYELLLREGENTEALAARVKALEAEAWGTKKFEGTLRGLEEREDAHLLDALPDYMAEALERAAPQQPYSRWADNNLHLIRDLYDLHGLVFIPTAKDDKQLQVNNFRVLVNAGDVLLHPRCVQTDRHFRTTTWENHKRRTYARKHGEHGDLLDCAVYGARNLNRQRNPFPKHFIRPVTHKQATEAKARVEADKALASAFLGYSPLGRKLMGGR